MNERFHKLLQDYKRELFHLQHDRRSVEEIATECISITDEVLNQKFSFHFKSLPSAERAEVINLINQYTREALLPPVVEKLIERQVLAERRVDALVHLVERLLENLSQPPPSKT
jgi:hypothetical protein